jgi:hypothetical protein
MRRVLIAATAGLAFMLSACGGDDEPATASGKEQQLQDRIDELEAEASERLAQEAEDRQKVREARRERRLERQRRARERRARVRREREREAALAAAPDAGVDQTSGGGGGGITVPNVVGLDHQAAQDALQGEGLWSLDEQDCSGQGRLLLFDRNWEVVRTDPPAGTQVSEDTTVTLCSVKQGE